MPTAWHRHRSRSTATLRGLHDPFLPSLRSRGGGVFTPSTSPETGFFYGSSVDTGQAMADLASCGCSGYHQVDVDGRVHRHGDEPHHGSLTDAIPAGCLNAPVVAMLRAGTGREL